jgi:hypothetical protein
VLRLIQASLARRLPSSAPTAKRSMVVATVVDMGMIVVETVVGIKETVAEARAQIVVEEVEKTVDDVEIAAGSDEHQGTKNLFHLKLVLDLD